MDWINLIQTYLVPALAVVITYLIYKWLKITVNKELIERILIAIISIITKVEQQAPAGYTGLQKKAEVIRQVENTLPKKQVSMIKKVYGGIEFAVEKAFQISHLAKKVKKIF